MSFEGIQFLQKYSLDKRYYNSEYNLAIHPIVQFAVSRVDIILTFPCGYFSPYSYHFLHKIPNADQCATRKLCIR